MKICLLIGGEGTGACAIVKAIACQELMAVCTGAISHSKTAKGIARLRALGIETQIADHQDIGDKKTFELTLKEMIDSQKPDIIALAGFMRVLSADFIAHYPNQIINIHPSLLPRHPGLNTHQRALDAEDEFHGATVHVVTKDCDQGPILMQANIPIFAKDTALTLKQRLQPLEHQLYIDTLSLIQKNTNFKKSRHLDVAQILAAKKEL